MEARNQMKMVSPHLIIQKLIFFKERDRRGSTRRDSIQPDRSSHLSAQILIFFKEWKRRGSIRRDSIQHQMEARNLMKMVNSHLSIQKLIFFKERDRSVVT
jgi:hypothetical protein